MEDNTIKLTWKETCWEFKETNKEQLAGLSIGLIKGIYDLCTTRHNVGYDYGWKVGNEDLAEQNFFKSHPELNP